MTDSAVEVMQLYRGVLASVTELTESSTARCSDGELVELAAIQEELSRRVEALTVQRFADSVERSPAPMIDSAGSVSSFYEQSFNVGRGELQRRRLHADQVAFGCSMVGERLGPELTDTAEALRRGQVSRTHVDVIVKVMRKIPRRVDAETRACAEATLAEFATQMTPRNLERVGTRLLAYLDPDGQITDDQDRRRQRNVALSPQDAQLMSRLTADLTPAARAVWEVAMELFAAKGMNNPDDPDSPRGAVTAPGLDSAVVAAAAKRDTRTTGQRMHDALLVICQYAIDAAAAGTTRNGLPAQVIVTASKNDIEDGRGFATTATGTVAPVPDVIDLLITDPDNPADMSLVVFDDKTYDVVYYGTGRRTASRAQRYAQFARDRGCTKPACAESMMRCQSHHVRRWEYGGPTTIGNLGAACGHDNRREGPGAEQWKTITINDGGPDTGRVGWIDPADPTHTPRVNKVHHPDVLLQRNWAARQWRAEQRRRARLPDLLQRE